MNPGKLQRAGLLFALRGWTVPWRHVDRAHDQASVQTNMADTSDLYFFGDDFDAILDILEDEEGLEEQFTEAADDVSTTICIEKCFLSIFCISWSAVVVLHQISCGCYRLLNTSVFLLKYLVFHILIKSNCKINF